MWTTGHWVGYVVEERCFFGGNEGIKAPGFPRGIKFSSSLL